MTKIRTYVSCATIVLLALTGCASSTTEASDGGTTAAGNAPKVSGLTLSKQTIAFGKLETLTAEFTYEDLEGDLAQVAVTLKAGGQSSTLPKSSIDTKGLKSGKAAVALAMQIPQAGPVEIHVTAVDAAGHASNEIVATITAQ